MVTKTSHKRPVALITGASSGIGEALAHCFAGGGHDLVLVARSADKLQALANELKASHGAKVWVEPADLSLRDAASGLYASLQRQHCAVDVLVNCAGIMEQSPFGRMTHAQHQRIIDLNISGLTGLLTHFLAPMVERGKGRILNVASVAAFQPIPMLATYAASKAYVLSLIRIVGGGAAGHRRHRHHPVPRYYRHPNALQRQRRQRPALANPRLFDCRGRRCGAPGL